MRDFQYILPQQPPALAAPSTLCSLWKLQDVSLLLNHYGERFVNSLKGVRVEPSRVCGYVFSCSVQRVDHVFEFVAEALHNDKYRWRGLGATMTHITFRRDARESWVVQQASQNPCSGAYPMRDLGNSFPAKRESAAH